MKSFIEKEWVTSCGLRAIVAMGEPPFLHRCGYVEVPKDHGLFKIEYQEIELYIGVHGGLTFSGSLPFHSDDSRHWFGYDCAHSGDKSYINPNGIERTLDYCIEECETLAKQLHKTPLALFYLWKKTGKLTVEDHNHILAWGIRDPKNEFVIKYIEESSLVKS
jgi:hypothetical protein